MDNVCTVSLRLASGLIPAPPVVYNMKKRAKFYFVLLPPNPTTKAFFSLYQEHKISQPD